MNEAQKLRAQRAAPLLWLTLFVLLSACAVVRAPDHVRVALFAPFEGRYQEVGYNALYAARLALADAGDVPVDLLPVDDGGTQATSHAAALTNDPLVMAAVVVGYDGTSADALTAFGDIPVLVVGDWGAQPIGDHVFILSNPQIDAQLTASPRISVIDAAALPAPVTGGDVFALDGFAKLHSDLDRVTILSSGSLPDADFVQRYRASDQFAPTPGLLATLTYDAAVIAVQAAQNGSRTNAHGLISTIQHSGLNGAIHFEHSYWAEAPINAFQYVNGVLTHNVVK